MADRERRAKRCLEISCLEEIDVETDSFADIIIVIKNGLRKEEKKALLEAVAFPFQKCASAPRLSLGTYHFTAKEEECLWQMQF